MIGHAPAPAHASRRLAVLTAVVALGAAACGDDEGPSQPQPPGSTSTTASDGTVSGLDFASGSEVDLGDGWTVSPCESGPPLFCARLRGETQATVELLSVPTSSYPAVKEVLDAGGSPADALRAHAAEFQATFEQDRPAGCGAGYTVEPFGPEPAAVAGRPGMHYGFDGHQDGRHVERAVQFATIDGDTLHLILTNAVEDGTCMDDGELAEFSVAELMQLEPTLVRVVAASTLP